MSAYAAFRRQPVPQQFAQNLRTITIPAPTRGIIQSENEAFMQPGGANVQTNWATTMKGVKVRGGCVRWCDLPATTGRRSVLVPLWQVVTFYPSEQHRARRGRRFDLEGGRWRPLAQRPVTFAEHRALQPELW